MITFYILNKLVWMKMKKMQFSIKSQNNYTNFDKCAFFERWGIWVTNLQLLMRKSRNETEHNFKGPVGKKCLKGDLKSLT